MASSRSRSRGCTTSLDALPVGDAVDAACGTGRVTAHLAGLGHRVRGVDASPGMLAKARAKLPDVTFTEGSVQALPLPDDSSDLVTCCLSLAHVGELAPAFAEFARVLRPGGHLVMSDTRGHFVGSSRYPLVKWQADGSFGYLPTWHHLTSDYLKAALPLGFAVRRCRGAAAAARRRRPGGSAGAARRPGGSAGHLGAAQHGCPTQPTRSTATTLP